MSNFYFDAERYYSEENTCENEVFRSTILHHRKKLNICLSCQFITSQYQNRNLDWYKFQKQSLQLLYKKRCSLKFCKIHREVPSLRPATLSKKRLQQLFSCEVFEFFKNGFLQQNSRKMLPKCRYCKNKETEIECLCCREVDAMLIASAKIPECEGSIPSSSYYWHLLECQFNVK